MTVLYSARASTIIVSSPKKLTELQPDAITPINEVGDLGGLAYTLVQSEKIITYASWRWTFMEYTVFHSDFGKIHYYDL